MSPDRWRRVEELYHSALERGDSERAEYLAVACDGDEELHREVASLLETEYSPRPILDGEAMVVTAAPKLEVGTELGPYRIEGLLGEGGMGVVYRATDSRLGRTVAVKVLQNGAGADPQARERFTREARSISALSHPNICSLFDVGEHDGIGYLVLEYVEGETLAARLKKGPLAIDQVVRYGGQIADALAAAHARGMVHRDLKPGNVVLTSSGAKLLDFGLAKLAGPARPDEDPLTLKRVVVGTPGYMSPEQTEGRDCDARSDIYVLGLVLYEMAAGEKPTIPYSDIKPPQLNHVVQRCLAREAADRWHSAADVKLVLEMTSANVTATPATRSKWLRWIAAAAMVSVTVLAAALWMRRVISPGMGAAHLMVNLPQATIPAPLSPFPHVAISPDGKKLAIIVAQLENETSLWLRDLDSPGLRRLDQSPSAALPFWSPDSESIGYKSGGALWRIRQSGGPPQKLGEASVFGAGAWGADGTILIGGANGNILRIPAEGGAAVEVTKPNSADGERGVCYPVLLPDDKHFLYLAINRDQARNAIYVQDVKSSQRKLLLRNATAAYVSPSGQFLFVRSGTLFVQSLNLSRLELEGAPLAVTDGVATWDAATAPVYLGLASFSVSRNGVLAYVPRTPIPVATLVWFDRSGNRLATIGEPARFSKIALSPDERRVVVEVIEGGKREIRLIDAATGASSMLAHDPSVIALDPVWSPDSRRVAVGAALVGRGEIREVNVSTHASTVLYADQERKLLDDWSRDGRFIAYHSYDRNFALPLFGERKPLALEGTEFWDQVSFSPDSRWITFNTVSGRPEVFIASFPALAERRQISVGGGFQPLWSHNGTELFYVSVNGTLMSVPLRIGAGGSTLEPGVPKPMFDLGFSTPTWTQYQVSADERRFLAIQPVASGQADQIHVIMNWPALMRR
ncbi:MAG TPA: protein kinase [Candidatus Solibacter sp.]|nr:protein kinase [Candidatus Solibacter sp.]